MQSYFVIYNKYNDIFERLFSKKQHTEKISGGRIRRPPLKMCYILCTTIGMQLLTGFPCTSYLLERPVSTYLLDTIHLKNKAFSIFNIYYLVLTCFLNLIFIEVIVNLSIKYVSFCECILFNLFYYHLNYCNFLLFAGLNTVH